MLILLLLRGAVSVEDCCRVEVVAAGVAAYFVLRDAIERCRFGDLELEGFVVGPTVRFPWVDEIVDACSGLVVVAVQHVIVSVCKSTRGKGDVLGTLGPGANTSSPLPGMSIDMPPCPWYRGMVPAPWRGRWEAGWPPPTVQGAAPTVEVWGGNQWWVGWV